MTRTQEFVRAHCTGFARRDLDASLVCRRSLCGRLPLFVAGGGERRSASVARAFDEARRAEPARQPDAHRVTDADPGACVG